jgi:hypothetical protein
MIAAVELVSALVRRTGDAALVGGATRQLKAFSQVEFTARQRDVRFGSRAPASPAVPTRPSRLRCSWWPRHR